MTDATSSAVIAYPISPDPLVEGPPPLDLSPLRLDRFGVLAHDEEQLQKACLWRYAHHYAAEQKSTATT